MTESLNLSKLRHQPKSQHNSAVEVESKIKSANNSGIHQDLNSSCHRANEARLRFRNFTHGLAAGRFVEQGAAGGCVDWRAVHLILVHDQIPKPQQAS